MNDMRSSSVTRLADHDGRVRRAMAARRRLLEQSSGRGDDRSGGRAWINGRELGGTPSGVAHLAVTFD